MNILLKNKDLLLFCRLDQYAIAKFVESFEMVPRTLAENAGLNAMETISSLYAEHASGNTRVGIDLDEWVCKDVSTMSIWDLHVTKFFALKYAADAAWTVLRGDQIIMVKPAGGPRRDQPAGMDVDYIFEIIDFYLFILFVGLLAYVSTVS